MFIQKHQVTNRGQEFIRCQLFGHLTTWISLTFLTQKYQEISFLAVLYDFAKPTICRNLSM